MLLSPQNRVNFVKEVIFNDRVPAICSNLVIGLSSMSVVLATYLSWWK